MQIGEIWTDIFDMTDAYGEPQPLYAATKFAEQAKFDGADCVRVQYSQTTDADELKEFLGERWEDLAGKVEAEDTPDASDSKRIITSKFVREGERIVDPTTMLIYSETRRETSTTTYDYPEHGLLEIIETEEYEYGYEKIAP